MKCLRCGREMKNDKECTCGHFYETNLNKVIVHKKSKRQITLVELCAIIIIIIILVQVVMSFIINKNKVINENKDYCKMVCEGNIESIKKDTCICSNGQKYRIEK